MQRSARALGRAAKAGRIGNLRKARERLSEESDAARDAASIATAAWPFSSEEETAYLKDAYEQELIDEGRYIGLQVHRHETLLVASPRIIRILPDRCAVRVDRKQLLAIRPSQLARTLKSEQTAKPRFTSKQFLESLWEAYRDGVEKGMEIYGTPMRLSDIYRRLTRLPGVKREYSLTDFCRDLYLLDRSGLQETRQGVAFSFSASTGTRSTSHRLEFVDPDGYTVTYYAISFMERRKR